MAKCLFEVVWIKDKKVVAVTPRLEFKPFFELQYDGKSRYILQVRPRGAPGSEVQIAYLVEILCPQMRDITVSARKLTSLQQAQITKKWTKESLRKLGREYGVSHETVRRVIRAAKK